MNTKEIQELIAVFESSNLSRMEIEASDIKLKMEKPVGDVQIVSTPVSPCHSSAADAEMCSLYIP